MDPTNFNVTVAATKTKESPQQVSSDRPFAGIFEKINYHNFQKVFFSFDYSPLPLFRRGDFLCSKISILLSFCMCVCVCRSSLLAPFESETRVPNVHACARRRCSSNCRDLNTMGFLEKSDFRKIDGRGGDFFFEKVLVEGKEGRKK